MLSRSLFQAGDPDSPVIEIDNPIQGRSSYFPWEQEGVLSLQQALNSQSSVTGHDTQQLPPISYAALWDPAEQEGQETLDLSSTSTIPSYLPYSPPPSRLTILHPRHVVMTHPMSGTGQDQIPGHDHPVTSGRDEQEERRIRVKSGDGEEERPCKVCGEKAGKHSYYGGQVQHSLDQTCY